jgi:hypothetical protein
MTRRPELSDADLHMLADRDLIGLGLPEGQQDRTVRPQRTAGALARDFMATFLAVVGLLALAVLTLAALGVPHP